MADNFTFLDSARVTKTLRTTESGGIHTPHKLIEQNVIADANNSETGTDVLNAGNSYTFTGSGTSTLGVAGIQVSLFADKDCLVYIKQSPDNTNWDVVDKFVYAANSNFGVTVQAVNSYVLVQVTSLAETGAFRLQTCLCPVVEAVPRTLDQNGNFRIATPKDSLGFEARVTPMGELRTAKKVRIAGAQFDGSTVDSNYWTVPSLTGGTVTQAGTELTLTSGATLGNFARVYSVRRARYVAGISNKLRMHIRMQDTGTANLRRRWGLGWGASMPTVTDGAYFQLLDTTFSVVTMKGTSATTVSSGSFNGHSGYSYAFDTNYHVYEILYSNGKVYFSIDGVLLHAVSATAATWTNTMNFHLFMDVDTVVGAASAKAMYCRVASISRLGELESQPKYVHIAGAATTVCKLGAGFLHAININTAGTLCTVADSTTTTTPAIAIIDTAKATGNLGTMDYHCPFYDGLTVTTTGAGTDITVIYE